MSLDFADAFKHLRVRKNEMRFLSGCALGGFFVYRTVLFGIRTGPLVWGRMTALLVRPTQALFHSDRRRLQVSVDDPLLVARGTESQLANVFNITLLWWLTLGLKIVWRKGARGQEAEWTGAKIARDDSDSSGDQSKLDDWKQLPQDLEARSLGCYGLRGSFFS